MRSLRLPAVGLVLALAAICGSARAATLDASLGQARASVGAPAATATVMSCGRVLWSGASGVYATGSRRSVTPSTRFILASATKTVTAPMIMQQVQAGRLSLTTRLSAFYPQLANAGQITLRMLLNHTSGLADYFNNPRINSIINNQPRHRWTRQQIIAAIGRPQFRPGARYKYTNTNYVVLGGILEQVTGRSIESNFQRAVARPAGMQQSTFTYRPARSSWLPHPYDQNNDGSLTDNWVPGLGISSDYWGPVWTDGGLASTSTDLARFGQALFAGRLINRKTLAQMTVMGPFDYGLGIFDQRFDGRRWLGHDGDYGGFESENWTDPARHLTLAVTTDLTEADSAPDTTSDRIWRALVAAYDRTAATSPTCS
ncbi:MAG TPA: serine hydrolase domain-containing protein [Solirubrobacteraceae bacterium]|nr:serine hydrolase domain-containing protein [Solirubrobacteraceae bacterium]